VKYNEIALNFCQGFDKVYSHDIEKDTYYKGLFADLDYARIYIGSEVCSRYFFVFLKHFDEIVCKAQKKITLVLPDFKETEWRLLEEIIGKVADDAKVDEVVVNDFGTLSYCKKNLSDDKKIILGKLFNKCPREARIDMWNFEGITDKDYLSEIVYDTPFYEELIQHTNIDRIELDYIDDNYIKGLHIDQLKVGIHIPYTYITSGAICAMGSINNLELEKFSVDGHCQFECQKYFATLKNEKINRTIYSEGNTYYYLNDINIPFEYDEQAATRIIYKPIFSKGRE